MSHAVHGLWGALVHVASVDQLSFLLNGSAKVKQAMCRVMKNRKTAFEKSDTNKVRSVGLLYSGGVVSKRKYRHIYRAITLRYCQRKKKKVAINIPGGTTVDQPLSYDKLQSFIATVNTCAIHPLPNLPSGEPSPVKGARRSLEDVLLNMARRVLTVPHLRAKLK